MTKMTKTSKNVPIKQDLYLIVYEYIKTYNRLPKYIGSKQNLNYYIQRLKKDSLIIKKGYGVWEVNNPPKQVKINHRCIRTHYIGVKIRIPTIFNWQNREEYLKNKKIKYEKFKYNLRISINDNKIWLNNDSLTIYMGRNVFENTAQEGYNLVIYYLQQTLISLENLLNIDIKFNGKYQFRVFRQHYGIINDNLAKQCNKEGLKIECYYNNERWLVIDNSLNLNETELTSAKTGIQDTDNLMQPFLNDIKDYYMKTGEVPLLSSIIKATSDLTTNWKYYGENIVIHVKAVQDLNKGVNKFTKEIQKFNQKKLNDF